MSLFNTSQQLIMLTLTVDFIDQDSFYLIIITMPFQ